MRPDRRSASPVSRNKELVAQLIRHFNARDADGLEPLVTDTVKHTAAGTAFHADLEGRDAFMRYIRHDVLAKFERVHFEPCNVYEDAQAGVVTAEWRGEFTLKNGRSYSSKGVFVVEIRDGRIDWLRDYFDTEKTKRAVG
jgi:ketosteroid isomerase-like protein